jgi:hypothetical protein
MCDGITFRLSCCKLVHDDSQDVVRTGLGESVALGERDLDNAESDKWRAWYQKKKKKKVPDAQITRDLRFTRQNHNEQICLGLICYS